ncbi:MAG: polysaccharide deacetylase family protein [Polyangiaceae bacterium]|nr:polysaccharide deacetylase family protein [Polyangiaceae bacterium]
MEIAQKNRLRQAVRRALFGLLPSWALTERVENADRAVFLTFDDGPHPEHTPKLLDELARYGAKATFFAVGGRIAEHPEIARRIVAEGHTLGHHSYHHTDPSHTTAAQLAEEIEKTLALAKEHGLGVLRFFRPPHGKLTAGKLGRLMRSRQSTVLWNVDTKDYSCDHEWEIIAWLERNPLRPGDIALMHDNHAVAPRAIGAVLEQLQSSGLEAKALTIDHL